MEVPKMYSLTSSRGLKRKVMSIKSTEKYYQYQKEKEGFYLS